MPIFTRFGADLFTVYADFSRFIRDANGEKKNISLLMIFFTVRFFHGLPPLEVSPVPYGLGWSAEIMGSGTLVWVMWPCALTIYPQDGFSTNSD